jgi:hypothetical protein
VKQRLVHELVNAKLIVLSDVGGATGAEIGIGPCVSEFEAHHVYVGGAIGVGLEACVSLIRVNVDARGDAGGL